MATATATAALCIGMEIIDCGDKTCMVFVFAQVPSFITGFEYFHLAHAHPPPRIYPDGLIVSVPCLTLFLTSSFPGFASS